MNRNNFSRLAVLIQRLLLLSIVAWATFAAPLRAQEVSVPDPGLNSAIRLALSKPNGPLTQQDMLALTNLSACCRSITSIAGLEAAHNLTVLDLASNALTQCSLPAGLASLETLFLENNGLTNVVLPAGLNRLTQINLSGNKLTNLTLPPDMTRLLTLGLEGNLLDIFVLTEPLAATNLAATVDLLRNQGVEVFAYALTPRLFQFRQSHDAFRFSLTGPPGDYQILGTEDLRTWSQVRTIKNRFGIIGFTDAPIPFPSKKFYRAQRQGPPTNMVFIPPTTFTMGSADSEPDRNANEGPQTTVTQTRGFWIGRHEVTQGEYLSVMNTNPSVFTGDLGRAVSSVTWLDATNYCAKLTQRELAAGRIPPGSRYRLPTEAEWECAARAGTTTRFSYGDDPGYTGLANHAWFNPNGNLTAHPVGQKLANPWGLYDMEGNVWEWCQDWFGPLPGGAHTDPAGPASNPRGDKVMRGGAYDYPGSSCRSAARLFFPAFPFLADSDLGFRVVFAPEPVPQ